METEISIGDTFILVPVCPLGESGSLFHAAAGKPIRAQRRTGPSVDNMTPPQTMSLSPGQGTTWESWDPPYLLSMWNLSTISRVNKSCIH